MNQSHCELLASHCETEEASLIGMKPGCLKTAKRFIDATMVGDEQLDYVFHVQQCPDCRHYFETLSMMLMRRDRIREQLSKGGRH